MTDENEIYTRETNLSGKQMAAGFTLLAAIAGGPGLYTTLAPSGVSSEEGATIRLRLDNLDKEALYIEVKNEQLEDDLQTFEGSTNHRLTVLEIKQGECMTQLKAK